MSDTFELNAEVRVDMGKGASRRLRRLADQIPAILYGGEEPPTALSLVRKDLEYALENEAFYSHVLTLTVGGKKEKAILKDLQRHPAKDRILHADFLRVSENVAVKVNVPIHFINEDSCHGVKMEGGMIQHSITEIEVLCLPRDIPEFIEVDMADVHTSQIVHLSDVTLPEGVESVALSHGEDHDLAIASVLPPKGVGAAEEEEAVEAAAEEAPAAEGEEEGDSED